MIGVPGHIGERCPLTFTRSTVKNANTLACPGRDYDFEFRPSITRTARGLVGRLCFFIPQGNCPTEAIICGWNTHSGVTSNATSETARPTAQKIRTAPEY